MTGDLFKRVEVWHALSVHFPIALLLFSTLAMAISFVIKKEKRSHWRVGVSGLLLTGCLGAWISLYTGNLADAIVARKICDPTVLKEHEIAAQTMTYLFTIAACLGVSAFVKRFSEKLRLITAYLILALMLAGSFYLIKAGHLGASLVYQQGAGVINHYVECE